MHGRIIMETKIKFKHFEIRRPTYMGAIPEGYENDWDIVKWSDNFEYCYSIASLHWNSKEPCYELESVGMRLLEEMEDGLPEFIIKWVEFQETLLNLQSN